MENTVRRQVHPTKTNWETGQRRKAGLEGWMERESASESINVNMTMKRARQQQQNYWTEERKQGMYYSSLFSVFCVPT